MGIFTPLVQFIEKHKKGEEAAAEAVIINVAWTLAKRFGLVGAGIASAAVFSAVTASNVVHLAPGQSFNNYVYQTAPHYGVDPAASLSVSAMEGAGGGIGDNGTSFGPWQLHAGGALPMSVYHGPYSAATQSWAWSSAGVNYVLHEQGQLCHGLVGYSAVKCIAYRFERSANPAAETAGAWARYHYFHPTKPVHHSRAWHLRHRHGYRAWFDWALGVGPWKRYPPFKRHHPNVRPHTRKHIPLRWWHALATYERNHHLG